MSGDRGRTAALPRPARPPLDERDHPLSPGFVGLLAIVNPLGAVPVFLALTADRSHEERRAIARMAALTVLFVLLAATWGGEWILRFFGIGGLESGPWSLSLNLPAFRGEGVASCHGRRHAHHSRICHTEDEAEEARGRESVGRSWSHPLLERFFSVALVVWTVLHLAEPLGRWLGITGLISNPETDGFWPQIVAEGSVELFKL